MNPFLKAVYDLLLSFVSSPKNTEGRVLPGTITVQATLPSLHDVRSQEVRLRAAIISFARAQLGEPYKWGASGDGDLSDWDCSQLVMNSTKAGGLPCRDGCVYQYEDVQHRRTSSPQPGDPWYLGPSEKGIWHGGLYLGNGRVIHAKGGVGVIEQDAGEIERNPRFLGYFRHPDLAFPREERYGQVV